MGRRIYGKKTTVDGIIFDSEMEAGYYEFLKTKDIKDLRIHESYVIIEKYRDYQNNLFKETVYSPDFIYYNNEEERYYFIDVKGFLDDTSKLKWKLFVKHIMDLNEERYNNAVFSIIKYSKTTGFVDFKDYKKAMASARVKATREKNEAIKEKEQMKKDLLTIKKLRSKETPLTKLQGEKLNILVKKYKEYV